MPDVGLVQIEAHEVAQPPVVLEQMPLESGVSGQQPIEHLADGVAGKLDGVVAAGERAQRSGNGNCYGHSHTSLRTSIGSGLIADRSSSSTQLVSSAAPPRSTRTMM